MILSCFSLFITIDFFIDTYGKYLTDIDEQTEIKIARWKILVNGEDVRNSSTTEKTITPIFKDNKNIEDNVIAPGAEGYFDLIIDGSNADVSFKYNITTSINENSSVKDLIITGYSINNSEKIISNDAILEDNVLLNSENKIINIRVFIKWDESENSTMTNIEDTLATMTDEAKLDVSLTFTQILI